MRFIVILLFSTVVVFAQPVVTIHDIQYVNDPTGGASPYAGQVVTTHGIVTESDYGYDTCFFMSDPGGGPWSGILVFNPPAMPDRGDSVKVTGLIVEYYEYTEINYIEEIIILGQAEIPSPYLVRTGELPDSGEAYEGVLIQINDCVVTDTDDFLPYNFFEVDDGSGPGKVEYDDFQTYTYEPVVGDSLVYVIGCGLYLPTRVHSIAPRDNDDIHVVTSAGEPDPQGQVSAFSLFSNYPNPFNSSTRITYVLLRPCRATLTVYDIMGRMVETLTEEFHPAGTYTTMLSGSELSSGVYFIRLQADGFRQTRKMVLLK